MENIVIRFGVLKRTYSPMVNTLCTKIFKRGYMENVAPRESERKIHPYKCIHPWRSLAAFSKDLLDNVIYNKDGLVALNKPYGICNKTESSKAPFIHFIPNSVDYILDDALPYISKELGYSKLTVVRKPEKYMSGVTLLAADSKVEKAIEVSLRRANNFTRTLWVLTNRVPNLIKGKERLAIKQVPTQDAGHLRPTIVSSWHINEMKRRDVKILNVEYQVLSNSTLNLSSLIQIKSSTLKWHAVRLFAATCLYAPILGDNLYASAIQKVADTYTRIDPSLIVYRKPKLDPTLLTLLNIKPPQQDIIPAHIHLRSMVLPWFVEKHKDLKIEAPLLPPFDWSCRQLQFKYFMENETELCKRSN